MLEIERVSWHTPRYAVCDDRGHAGVWMRRRFGEAMTGEIGGEPYELRRDGRRRFVLVGHRTELATAEAARRGRWTVLVEGSTYELRWQSAWHSMMELRRGTITIGSIRKGRGGAGTSALRASSRAITADAGVHRVRGAPALESRGVQFRCCGEYREWIMRRASRPPLQRRPLEVPPETVRLDTVLASPRDATSATNSQSCLGAERVGASFARMSLGAERVGASFARMRRRRSPATMPAPGWTNLLSNYT